MKINHLLKAVAVLATAIVVTFCSTSVSVFALTEERLAHGSIYYDGKTITYDADAGYKWDAAKGDFVIDTGAGKSSSKGSTTVNDKTVSDAFDKLNSDDGNGTFGELEKTVTNAGASFFHMARISGIMFMATAAVVAIVCFAVLKNEASVQKHKAWLGRIVAGAFGLGAIFTVLSLASNLGSSF